MLINLLGRLELIVGGQMVEVRGRRKRALLALLAMYANEPISISELVQRLWGDDPPANARRSLRNAIAFLRTTLAMEQPPTARIVGAEACYTLELPDDAVDLAVARQLGRKGRAAFEEQRPAEAADLLRKALNMWRGAALCDVVVPSAAWPELAELQEEYLTLLEDVLEADCAAGRPAEVVEKLQTMIRAEPLRERLYGILMTALLSVGRAEEALTVYQDACAMLAEEWGIDPGQYLRELRELLSASEPAPAAAPLTRISGATVLMLRPSAFPVAAEDPEVEALLLDRWSAVVGQHVERHGGYVVLSLGNCMLAVFEAENAAESAVRSALATRATLANAGWWSSASRITMCAAITTGDVRAAVDLTSHEAFQLTGDAVDACYALLSAAAECGVLVAESTYRASRHAIAYRRSPCAPAAYEALGIAGANHSARPFIADHTSAQGVGVG
jgi:DNA-binding SARP family transcriptional activator